MDVYQNIWSSCDKVQLDRHGRLVSDAAVQHGLFQHEDDKLLKAHVREVNSLLNNNKTRDRGLRLLADLVPQCTQQVLSAQCERWFRFCCEAATGVQRGRRVEQACKLVSALLRDLPSLPELQRCVTSKASAAIVPELAAIDPQKNPAALECVYEYVRAAPGPCLQHKNVLEERMLNHLDYPVTPASLGASVVRLAGKVFAALPLPGVGGGNVAQSRADARGRQLTLLLALAHSLMDTLLDGVLEKESYPHSRDHGSLKLRPVEDVTSDPMTTRLVSIARLSNTLTFVAEMVTDAANTAITITPDHLLSVVFRLLQMEAGVLARYKSQEHKLVAFFLPSLHNQALLLLRDIIDSLGDAIDSYYNLLTDLLVFALCSYKTSGAKKEERPVWCSGGLETRVLTYGVLAELLKASRGRHSPPSGLVAMVVQDAGPQEHRVKLQEKGLAGLSLHKAAGKKKGYTVTSQASSGGPSGPLPRPGRFSRLARVSLVVAEMLFTHSAHSMTFEDHQRLQSGVLTIAQGVVGASHPPEIYRDARVRVQLFHTLAALSAAPHPRCPPPYTLLTHLLRSGSMDSDTQVASACQMAMCAVSLVVANPKVELASQAFRQHQHDSGGISGDTQDVGKDEEVDMIIEQLQEEEEEEKEEEEEVTEEPTVSNNELQEESVDEEEVEEDDDDDDDNDEAVKAKEKANVWGNSDSKESDYDEEEDTGEKEPADIEKEIKDSEGEEKEEEDAKKGGNRGKKGKGKTSSRKNDPVEDSDERQEERDVDEDEDEDEETEKVKTGGSKRGERKTERTDSGKGKQSQETQTKASKKRTKSRKRTKNKQKVTEEEMEEANSSSTGKRNGSKGEQPAKRVKPSGDQQEVRRESKDLTVDEMLKDFVG